MPGSSNNKGRSNLSTGKDDMYIEILGPAVPAADGGVAYRLMVDGRQVALHATLEALQDVDPSNWCGDPISQFNACREVFLGAAEEKMRAGHPDFDGNTVLVRSMDVRGF